ncbi:MAG: hypothetical protein Q9184_004977, partial [Pyrenodesmia sp. 2 TL-2023]
MSSIVRLNYFPPSDPTGPFAMDSIPFPHNEGIMRRHESPKPRTSRRNFGAGVRERPDNRKIPSESVVPRDTHNVSERSIKALDRTEEKRLGRELVWLRDPLKLAENTISLLKDNKSEKAISIVRLASKKASCVVSWNHLIDYEMSKGNIQKAVKIYNEVGNPYIDQGVDVNIPQMKKRAQQPDAQTYTIVLRGLSWHTHLRESLPRALKIYHSMFAENCPIKPNIIHTNTVLKVCALAKDMDALWGVAAKLPTKGIGASNNLTFTIILNALRSISFDYDADVPDEQEVERDMRRQRAVMEGRRIWEEIIPRWRAGDIWIDEELTCAMGRLLLLGSTELDYDDVLSLAEQTMAVPRQMPRLRNPEELPGPNDPPAITPVNAETEESTTQQTRLLEWSPSEDGEQTSAPQETDAISPLSAPAMTPALANVFQPEKSTPSNVPLARPGRNTLSLLLKACIALRAVPSAQRYWGLLTSPTGPYNIIPDSENYHQYLRLLRVQRASALAADLITDMHSGELKSQRILQAKTFRIALSCCVRNKNSPSCIAQAQRIVEIMYRTLEYPDTTTLEMFTLIITTRGGVRTDYRPSLAALRVLEQGMLLLKNMVSFGLGDVSRETKGAVVGLARRVIGAYDFVIDVAGDQLDGEERSWCVKMKKTWSAWAQKWREMAQVTRMGWRGRGGKKEEEEEEGDRWEGPRIGREHVAN